MNVKSLGFVITNHLAVFGSLLRPVLTLPAELMIGNEMIDVLVVRISARFLQANEQKNVRFANDEPNIPDGCAKYKTESWWNGLA